MEKLKGEIMIESPEFYETGSARFTLMKVDSRLSGSIIEEFNRRNPQFEITLVYNEHGEPMFPYPDLRLASGWYCRLFEVI